MLVTLNNINCLQEQNNNESIIRKARVVGSNTVPKYRLLEELTIQLSNSDIITIPVGFEWDLSSVPRLLWGLLPPDGDWEIAMLIHDYLYTHKNDFEYTRYFADKEMLLWSKATSKTTKRISLRNLDIYTRYYAVRGFGWIYWNRR